MNKEDAVKKCIDCEGECGKCALNTLEEEQAAANKATEEGGLPMTIGGKYNWKGQPEQLTYLGRNWSGNGYWHQFEKVNAPGVIWCEVLDADLSSFEETKPIAADRASRQVANKAEVDLSSLPRYTVGVERCTMDRNDIEGNWVSLREVKALLATPPATTGASTAAFEDVLKYGTGITRINPDLSVEHVPYENVVGASTVLTDERIIEMAHAHGVESREFSDAETIALVREVEREVAAQAGQVAVPGWTWAPDLKIADDEVIFYSQINQTATGLPVMTDSSQHSTWNVASVFKRPAEGVNSRDPLYVIPVEPFAPSPAKESK